MSGFSPFQLIEPTDLNDILNGTPFTSFTIGWDGVSEKSGTITLNVVNGSFGNVILQSNATALGNINITLPNSSGTLLTTGDLDTFTSNSITTTEFYVNNSKLSINTETGVFGLVSLVSSTIDTNLLTAETVATESLTLNGWLFEVV